MGAGRGGGFPQDPNSPAFLPAVIFPLGHPPALGTCPVPAPTTMIAEKMGGMPQDWAGIEVEDAVPWAGDSAMRMGGDYSGCHAPDTHE